VEICRPPAAGYKFFKERRRIEADSQFLDFILFIYLFCFSPLSKTISMNRCQGLSNNSWLN